MSPFTTNDMHACENAVQLNVVRAIGEIPASLSALVVHILHNLLVINKYDGGI